MRKDPNLDQPLTYNGEIWKYKENLVGFGAGDGREININANDIEKHDGDHFRYQSNKYPDTWRWILLITVIIVVLIIKCS